MAGSHCSSFSVTDNEMVQRVFRAEIYVWKLGSRIVTYFPGQWASLAICFAKSASLLSWVATGTTYLCGVVRKILTSASDRFLG
ncbi:unnamed protein product [Haemonchus placei]|uniref:Uncharacterized protein n=1 Tax=Haemonchus placei TaxID=6290 RepID=A0A3P7VQX7_HAEPC|nr:unnamed protein product [Haemonchus placei]